MPELGKVPDYLAQNKVLVDWYPKLTAMFAPDVKAGGSGASEMNEARLSAQHVAFLRMDWLYFELEKYKARENLHSLIIRPAALASLLCDASWYRLLVPAHVMDLKRYANVQAWNQIALELLKKYCDSLYAHKRDAFILPRLHVVLLERGDANLPADESCYTLTVDASETQLITDIKTLQADIENARAADSKAGKTRKSKLDGLLKSGDLKAILLGNHLYQPLVHARKGLLLSISPVTLNESETDFVMALVHWLERHEARLVEEATSIYLLRNKSRGSGVGFFEAGNFYPDFILWAVTGKKQVVLFVEPHGMGNEAQSSLKVQFRELIKDIEVRLDDPDLRLESAIVTPTEFAQIKDRGLSISDWASRHVFFMTAQTAQGDPLFMEQVMALLLAPKVVHALNA